MYENYTLKPLEEELKSLNMDEAYNRAIQRENECLAQILECSVEDLASFGFETTDGQDETETSEKANITESNDNDNDNNSNDNDEKSESDETDETDETDDLDERKMTKLGRMRAKGPHKKGFHRIKKADGGYVFKKVTTAMKAKARKKSKKASAKRKASLAYKKLQLRGFGEGIDESMSKLHNSFAIMEEVKDEDKPELHQEYVEFLDGARHMAAKLIEFFEKHELDDEVKKLEIVGAMAENALENIYDDDEVTQEMSEDLDQGTKIIVNVLRKAVERYKEIKEGSLDEDDELDFDSDELPEIFFSGDEDDNDDDGVDEATKKGKSSRKKDKSKKINWKAKDKKSKEFIRSLIRQGNIKDPEALGAWIGREYGGLT